jgi:hypothetical protein
MSQPTSIRVSNLGPETEEEHLRPIFGQCGAITGISVAKHKETGENLGNAKIDYTCHEDAKKAVETLHNYRLHYMVLRVEYCQVPPPPPVLPPEDVLLGTFSEVPGEELDEVLDLKKEEIQSSLEQVKVDIAGYEARLGAPSEADLADLKTLLAEWDQARQYLEVYEEALKLAPSLDGNECRCGTNRGADCDCWEDFFRDEDDYWSDAGRPDPEEEDRQSDDYYGRRREEDEWSDR